MPGLEEGAGHRPLQIVVLLQLFVVADPVPKDVVGAPAGLVRDVDESLLLVDQGDVAVGVSAVLGQGGDQAGLVLVEVDGEGREQGVHQVPSGKVCS
mgnify:CR=1 FL=1